MVTDLKKLHKIVRFLFWLHLRVCWISWNWVNVIFVIYMNMTIEKSAKGFFRFLGSWEIPKNFGVAFFLPTLLYLPYFQPHQYFSRLTGMIFSYANTTRWSWWWITITFWYKPDTIDGHARPAILQYFYTTQNILTLIFYAINQAKKGSKILVFFLHIQLHFFNAELTFSICSKMNFTITSSEIK